jgi:branched-chain amino acid aminotransferase
MNILRYINHNGVIIPDNSTSLNHNNRAFAYGDGFFETMHGNGMNVQFFSYHWQRIKKACEILDYKLPFELNDEGEGLAKQITKLLHRNRFFQGVRIRVSFYRNSGGYYYPTEQRLSYLIQVEKLADSNYVLNKIGLYCDIGEDLPHPKLPWSEIKTINSLVFIHASRFVRLMELDDVFFVDKNDYLIESVASNIFVVAENKLYTPPLSEGCVNGVMRQVILNNAATIGLVAKEKKMKSEILTQAEEVWLTNAVNGVRWVSRYRKSRYFHNKATLMTEQINKLSIH